MVLGKWDYEDSFGKLQILLPKKERPSQKTLAFNPREKDNVRDVGFYALKLIDL